MQVARWGNSLAVRVPTELAVRLGLTEGKVVSLRGKPRVDTSALGGLSEGQTGYDAGEKHTATVGRWGNSVGFRLPQDLINSLGIVEGDNVEVRDRGTGMIEIEKEMTRDEAIAAIRALRGMFPAGYKFDRDEANSRIPYNED